MGSPVQVNEADFEKSVVESSLPVLVDFWAQWCGPCRMVAPIVEELAKEMDGKLVVAKVDVDANAQLAAKFGVQSIPTVMLFKAGKPVKTLVGYLPKAEFRKALSEAGIA